ncbi:DNA-binding MarR family transcriptional regulator/GNAT superfamily N-acetyltransferase [Amycolatopsis bartoniae]|uniref:Putative transcriptional regulator, MarR family protein n=1 Tax=Amycolatopsis bartoniae TaxID=941986 RepID=A0A8H9IVD6_9PSEU|nr:MarR family winged helix-turn-helix transcriptional regulator [Amycolatopsis bartoniae]MBB2939000.1 DNA-binding MarR family transcriptional regulator/GNAT superfamily N-acetyltransferase [Amycolatopsis bartoniae]TVT04255.1 winged helix-turn-helix transcriptional regulator [Amycolatopsis bartoniae]GHF65670.1 putative transcriptional regulator, MarR family protein [Amycolatopsis bartoniae]
MDAIPEVRRFNRAVTQRVGALQDAYLSRDRPLGQARVLWEIGSDGCDVRALRAKLDLDSGYLSRLLRALERDGLVVVEPSGADARVRTARLTGRGRAERETLDRRSDELAASILAPLGERQRVRLVAAMAEVERLLTASTVEVAAVDPTGPERQSCLAAYSAELDERFEDGFELSRSLTPDLAVMTPPEGLFLVATLHGEPVGCGGFVYQDGGDAVYLKRMWVSSAVRGLGLGRRLLAELERHGLAGGARVARLETNRALKEAIGLYRAAGYREVAPFNDEPYAHHWFEKELRG